MSASSPSNRTVDRALDILGIVAGRNKEGMIFSDIARALGAPKSSISSIMTSLVDKGFLSFSQTDRRYYLGEALFNLGNLFLDGSNILQLIENVLAKAVDETGYTSFFGVLSGDETRYLLRKVSAKQEYTPASPQYALKASCTGLGKALLLDSSKEQLDVLFSEGMPKVTENTITSVDVLYKQLLFCRAKDIVFEKEESSPRIQCRATPIRYSGKIIAAVSLSFPSCISDADEMDRIEKVLMTERTSIERLIEQNPHNWIYSNLY